MQCKCFSSLDKKFLMALTGLGLSGFVLTHMAANLLLFVSPEAYNNYGHKLATNPMLLYPAEIGLVAMFILHIYLGITLSLQNSSARPDRYLVSPSGEKAASFASKTMIYSGILIFVFTVLHLIMFKYGTYYEATYDGVVMRDLYQLVMEEFQNPLIVGWYVFAVLVLGIHLSHGISSTFQSLGIYQKRLRPIFLKIGYGFAAIITIGFAAQPIYFFLAGGN